MRLSDPKYPASYFTVFRVILGVYLCVHFGMLVPYAPEIFSREGMIPDPSLQPTYSVFPNLMVLIDTPIGTQLFLSALTVLAIAFTAGWKRSWVSLLLWYGWACLFNRNIFTANPGLPMVGWLLLACSLIPRGEPLALGESQDRNWRMPPAIFWGAWFLMSLGYTVSGIHKLGSPSWADGTALRHLMENPLARDVPWREWLLAAPPWILKAKTYLSLGLEVLFLPLALLSWTRPWIWVALIGMHLGILSLVSFADLTLGVLMMHLFTFDSRWVRPRRLKGETPILFFDGVCGLCNGFVDFIIAEERASRFRFSPIQSDFARAKLGAKAQGELASSYVLDEGAVLEKSDAVLRVASHLGGFWRLVSMVRLIPRPIRDAVYDWIATNRYRWFGKKESCRIPSPEERARFVLE